PTEGDGQYQRLLKTLSERHRDMRVAGFTATPWRMDGGHIVGPGNPLNYTAYQIEPALLMNEGFLVRPQWSRTLYPIETGKARSRQGDFLNEDLRSAAAVQHKERMQDLLTRTADRKNVIVFTIDRKHARMVARVLPGSVVIDGSIDSEARDQRLRDFAEGKYRYLVNVDLFIEGFDLPKIDAVAVLRPTQSASRWIQMVGRGLRTAEGKEDCLVLDYGGNLERFPMRPDEPGFFRYDPKGQGANIPGTLVSGPANPEAPVELPAPLTHDVTRVDATTFHSNHKDRDFLKIRYYVGMTAVEQTWVVPSKDFGDFWTRHGFGPVPKTPQEAMLRVRDGDLLLPRAVSLRYRANPDKPFGYSEIVSEVHSWAETMRHRHTFYTVPGHEAGESSGYQKGMPSMIRPTPLYGQKVYVDLVERDAVPESGRWVTAYPTPDGERVHYEQPVILYNNHTGMSYVAEKAELDRMLKSVLGHEASVSSVEAETFRAWDRRTPLSVPGPVVTFEGKPSLLAPHDLGNLGYRCAQQQLFEAARSWWELAAERGDVAAQKNLALLDQWMPRRVELPKQTVAEREGAAFAYGGRRP
ncbi:helicase-related protein, partial [Acidithiobacillus sp.]|uniref:DEAD/DEAH box helicase n=1 Tax=Acidithiobacillus sp. TaxID=1872118 RepID=UPI003D0061DA